MWEVVTGAGCGLGRLRGSWLVGGDSSVVGGRLCGACLGCSGDILRVTSTAFSLSCTIDQPPLTTPTCVRSSALNLTRYPSVLSPDTSMGMFSFSPRRKASRASSTIPHTSLPSSLPSSASFGSSTKGAASFIGDISTRHPQIACPITPPERSVIEALTWDSPEAHLDSSPTAPRPPLPPPRPSISR
ncbi:hypothetical protein E2C01_072687 [Portunus trituberculatus]|uniref:Uncharacterized protein n=1 Tax=Portunus trituberculatus TaxID=210409 RepID=A0A5B7I7U5_PORTR|nr:hypothetical protein [Portunus trituberculatus]